MNPEQRQRLQQHLESRLGEIGVVWKPVGLQYAGPVQIVEQVDWPPVFLPPGEVDGLVCVDSLTNKDGTYRMQFKGFYLLFYDGIDYATLFGTAIHEGAHVMHWRERIMATGNKFTEEDLTKFKKCSHGSDFNRWDSQLLEQARELGFVKSEPIPSGVADLFQR